MAEKIIWNEETIRREIRRLDKLTGLHGADLQITFGKARSRLGAFHLDPKTREPWKFYFSRFYFDNPEWSTKSALDVIRHEYAHYMDYMVNGNLGHGSTWKACCIKVGADPSRLYNEKVEAFYKKEEAAKKAISDQIDRFLPGMKISHPKFGIGTIKAITGIDEKRILEVEFQKVGTKRLGAAWVNENCVLIP